MIRAVKGLSSEAPVPHVLEEEGSVDRQEARHPTAILGV